MAENNQKNSNKANIDLEIKLPNVDKPFYNKLSTENNMFTQIKKAGSKLDDNQNLDVWVNSSKNIKLSKADILNENLKENVNERISLLGNLEKAERTAISMKIKYASDLDDKGIKTYHINGNSQTDEKGFIEHIKKSEVTHHKEESDKWARELSNRTDLSKGLTNSQIDEKQAYHFNMYEIRSKELGLEITASISDKTGVQNSQAEINNNSVTDKEKEIIGTITYVDSGEIVEFNSKEDYLKSIEDQLDHNSPTSFQAETILKEPELLKKVDDIYYGHGGEENPNSIDFYNGNLNKSVDEKPSNEPQVFFYAEYYDSKKEEGFEHTLNPTANYSEVKDVLSKMAQNATGDIFVDVTISVAEKSNEFRFQKNSLNETLKDIEKIINNREINKGMDQNNQSQQSAAPKGEKVNQPQFTEFQQKNLDFLKEQIKFKGFGEDPNLHKELMEKFSSKDEKFEIHLSSDKATFHKADFKLNFQRSESTGRVFLNSFDTTLSNDKKGVSLSQNFSTTKESFTAKESINLLEGRAVKTQIERNGEKENVFVELKLKEDKNQYGNFQKQHYYQNYGVDAAKAVAKEKFIFQDDKHKDITIKSLEKGNVVNAKFTHPNTNEVVTGKAVLNVAYKTVNLYDENMKRINGNEKAFVKDIGESEENNTRKQQNQSRSM